MCSIPSRCHYPSSGRHSGTAPAPAKHSGATQFPTPTRRYSARTTLHGRGRGRRSHQDPPDVGLHGRHRDVQLRRDLRVGRRARSARISSSRGQRVGQVIADPHLAGRFAWQRLRSPSFTAPPITAPFFTARPSPRLHRPSFAEHRRTCAISRAAERADNAESPAATSRMATSRSSGAASSAGTGRTGGDGPSDVFVDVEGGQHQDARPAPPRPSGSPAAAMRRVASMPSDPADP